MANVNISTNRVGAPAIRVVLCDDHALVRRGIRDTLAEEPDIVVVGEAASYAEAREVLREIPCDVLVLDLGLPGRGGLDVLESLRATGSEVKVLVVSMFPEDQYALRCLRAGAHGYVNKAHDPAELAVAVRDLAQGRKHLTPTVAQMLVESLSRPPALTAHAALSERELQTLTKIASGKRLSEIAEELMLSPKTVSVYRARVLEKLRLSNNAELAVFAIRNGLV
jgi:two-component system invasion response regulator UvrY